METARIARLVDLDDYEVADGEPDVRGWKVKTRDDREVGKVENLIVDVRAMKVCYFEVELDRGALRLGQVRRVLVPIGAARLDEHEKTIFLGLTGVELIAAPAYDARAFTQLDHEALQRRYAAHLGHSEEELAVGTRRRMADKVEVSGRIETEREPATRPG